MPRSALTARLPSLTLMLAAGAVAVYGAGKVGGAAAAIPAALAFACAAGLLVRREQVVGDALALERLLDAIVLAVPGVLTVLLALQSGGYFPDATAFAALVLIVLLVLRVTLAEDPFAGVTRALTAAAVALSLFAVWTLASAGWSDAPARALVEFDRVLLYLLTFVLVGSVARSPERLRWMLRGLALGIVAVAVIALLTRLFATTFPTPRNLGNEQLSYPLGYSNSLAVLCSLGAVLCLHLTCDLAERPVVRALAAGSLPILAVTAYFTFSRGGIAAGILGVAAYIVLGRPRALVTGALASVPLAVVAVVVAYDKHDLAVKDVTTATASAQGSDLAVWILACSLLAAVLRLALSAADRRLESIRLPDHLRRPVTGAAWAAAIVIALVIALVANVPSRALDYADRFVNSESIRSASNKADIRSSILTLENSGLPDNWRVALDGFSHHPIAGLGAGAYGLYWDRQRPGDQHAYDVLDAHSLYLEVLAELGIVGLLALVLALALILAALAPVRRGSSRALYAALFACALAWAVHSGVEWNWEMPAVTLWLFAAGAAALAARRVDDRAGAVASWMSRSWWMGPSQAARVGIGAALLAVAVCPALLLLSQHRLDDAVRAYYRGDCARTIDRATAAISVLERRPEPYEAIAYCQTRRGNDALAIQAMRMAVSREPGNWHLHFGLALVRGAAGLDPRPDAREALRLNPHAPRAGALVRVLANATPAQRRQITGDLAVTEALSVVR